MRDVPNLGEREIYSIVFENGEHWVTEDDEEIIPDPDLIGGWTKFEHGVMIKSNLVKAATLVYKTQ